MKDTPPLDAREDDWIPWTGGECPVAAYVPVLVKFRDGWTMTLGTPAHFWGTSGRHSNWDHTKESGNDIIAYRVVQP